MTDTKNVLNLLRDVRKLIEKEENWTQWLFARDAAGHCTDPLSSDATCFCLLGALYRALGTTAQDACFPLVKEVWGFLPRGYLGLEDYHEIATEISVYNDNNSHAEVLALLDKAIEAAQ